MIPSHVSPSLDNQIRAAIQEKEAAIKQAIMFAHKDDTLTRDEIKSKSQMVRYKDGVEVFRFGKEDLIQFQPLQSVQRGSSFYLEMEYRNLYKTGPDAYRKIYL